jgi:hypothetical protein
MTARRLICVCVALALAACESVPPGPDALPTVLVLPSETSTIEATPRTPTQIATLTATGETTTVALNLPTATSIEQGTPEGERVVVRSTPGTATGTATASATATGTPTQTGTVQPTLSPSTTITDTPTRTVTVTPYTEEDLSPLFQLAIVALSSTPPPTGFYVPPTQTSVAAVVVPPSGPATLCPPPPGGFGAVYAVDPATASLIGCQLGVVLSYPAAVQTFERGTMVYVGTAPSAIYVLYAGGNFVRYPDTWIDGVDPVSGGETPPAGLFEPIRGFGKLWRNDPSVRNGLGWATQPESGTTASLLLFQAGQMISLPPLGQIAVMTTAGTYRLIAGSG